MRRTAAAIATAVAVCFLIAVLLPHSPSLSRLRADLGPQLRRFESVIHTPPPAPQKYEDAASRSLTVDGAASNASMATQTEQRAQDVAGETAGQPFRAVELAKGHTEEGPHAAVGKHFIEPQEGLSHNVTWVDREALVRARIIPDVVDSLAPESDAARVEFRVIFGDKPVVAGERLPADEVSKAPKVVLSGDGLYSIVMTDPDAPSPKDPKYAEWLHWMLVNIDGHNFLDHHIVTGWQGPSPPTGIHRYVISLFRQQDDKPIDPVAPNNRSRFSTRTFSELFGLGDPLRVAFFTTAAPGTDKEE